MDEKLLGRSIRTLAWSGDAAFEREVRWRVARRGDYPIDRLDAIKAEISVCAPAQARLLAGIADALDEAERAVARRARNAANPGSSRGRRSGQDYREATALEAVVAHWSLRGPAGHDRFEAVLAPPSRRRSTTPWVGDRGGIRRG